MTDNEIIKALECCSLSDCMADCIRLRCPFFIERGFNRGCGLKDEYNGKRKLYEYALDLINRQQAELERLKKIQQTQADRLIEERGQKYEQIEVISKLKKQLETAKFEVERNRRIIQDHETIIEMLEKELKTTKSETIREFAERAKEAICSYVNAEDDIDQIVEEMIGEM